MVFGGSEVLMMSLPPTVNSPPDKKLMYQTRGSFNQTYVFPGSNIIYVFPVNSETNSCSMLTSRVLLKETENTKIEEAEDSKEIREENLFINNIESASTVISFEKISDEELQKIDTVRIDLYYKKSRDYLKSTYQISFAYYKANKWIWLWVSLGCIVLILLFITGLFIAKCCKAINKAGNNSLLDDLPEDHLEKFTKYTSEDVVGLDKYSKSSLGKISPLKTKWTK